MDFGMMILHQINFDIMVYYVIFAAFRYLALEIEGFLK